MIDFAFEEEIRKSTRDAKNYVLDGVKGLSYPSLGFGYVNLNAENWKYFLHYDSFVEALTKTITHEYVHLLIGTTALPDEEPTGYTWKGEEVVCRLLANQPIKGAEEALVKCMKH